MVMPHLAYSEGRAVQALRKEPSKYNRNLAQLIFGAPGYYEMVAYGMRLRGLLVLRTTKKGRSGLQFLPFELKELKTTRIIYSRAKDTKKIFITHKYLCGAGSLYEAPPTKRLSEDNLDDIADVQWVMLAAVFSYVSETMHGK
jgi:hypothetical protein